MAAAAVAIPSYNRVEPGSNQLKQAVYPKPAPPPKVDVDKVAVEWVHGFNKILAGNNDGIKELFLPGSCWRDQLGLSWDYHSLNGPEKIEAFLKESSKGCRVKSIAVDKTNPVRQPQLNPIDYYGEVTGVGFFLTVDTDVGRGRGLVQLLQDTEDGGKWKVFTLLTTMQELKGHEETTFGNRPHGVEHGGQPGRKNWQDRRNNQENYEGELEPTVLIIGKISVLC